MADERLARFLTRFASLLTDLMLNLVDHPIRDVQFEAKSRIFEEAAGQVFDHLAGDLDGEAKE